MKKITKLLALFLVVAMSVSLFAGCHKEQTDTAKVSISYWLAGNVDTMEPGMSLDSVAQAILSNTYVPLVYIDNQCKRIFKAATSCDISDDGLIYTFHLREDAKWSDGKPVLASDYEYGWKRLADPAHICANAYEFTLLKNGMNVVTGKVPASELGVKAVDEYTLRVELEAPANYFINKLANSAWYPQRKDICESDDAWFRDVTKLGICTGPYMVTKWVMNSELTLTKNPNFYDADKVRIDEIIVPLLDDADPALTAFEAGQLDGLVGTPEITRQLIESPEDVIIIPGSATLILLLNATKPPLDDVRVRKALCLALNRSEIVRVRGESKYAKPVVSIIPPGIFFNGEEMHNVGETLFGIDPNKAKLDEAKALLADAGYPNGEGLPPITIVTSSGSNETDQMIASMWEELGVKIELQPYEYKVFMDMLSAGDYQITIHMYGEALEPFNFLETWLPGRGFNAMGYDPPEYEEAFKKASMDPDLTVQKEQLLKAEEILMNGYVVCPILNRSFTFTQNPKLKGVTYRMDYPFFENAYIEE